MPGAMAKGTLAQTPNNKVPKMALKAVTVIRASFGIPASARILGWTAMIYDIVKKVVIPAIISRLMVVPCWLRLNMRWSMAFVPAESCNILRSA